MICIQLQSPFQSFSRRIRCIFSDSNRSIFRFILLVLLLFHFSLSLSPSLVYSLDLCIAVDNYRQFVWFDWCRCDSMHGKTILQSHFAVFCCAGNWNVGRWCAVTFDATCNAHVCGARRSAHEHDVQRFGRIAWHHFLFRYGTCAGNGGRMA